jgi:hypothetical protein
LQTWGVVSISLEAVQALVLAGDTAELEAEEEDDQDLWV